MNNTLRAAAAAGLALLCSGCASHSRPDSRAQDLVTLSIVGTNDLHGSLLPKDGRGGLALFSGHLKNLRAARARDGGGVVLLDAGDMFQGTLESNAGEGAAVIAAYNILGYTAAALGNHEFDFGPVGPAVTANSPADDPRGALKARTREATFPILAANLIDNATAASVRWPNVTPTAMVRVAGVSVGLIGVMTRTALTATMAANVRDLSIAPLAETIRTHAAALRQRGASVIVVSAHAGGRCTQFDRPQDLSSCEDQSEIFRVARELPPGAVDVIVAGHTHAPIGHEVAGVAITEAYSNGRSFGRVDLSIDRRTGRVAAKRIFAPRDLVADDYEGAPVVPDPAIDRVLAPALEAVRPIKEKPMGIRLDTPIRRLTPISPLGHLFSDAMLAGSPGADAAVNNSSGGLRADLPAGPLTYGSVFEVMPFDNLLVQIDLTGKQLRRVLTRQIEGGRRVVGFSGLRVRADCKGGTTEVTMTRPSGAIVSDEESLRVAVTDFVAAGGDNILTEVIPPGGFALNPAAPLVREVFADYLRRLKSPLREEPLLEKDAPRLSLSAECSKS